MRREGRATAAQVYPPPSRWAGLRRLALVACLVPVLGIGPQAPTVDRLVAVVEQRALMQSDVEIASRLGAIVVPAPEGLSQVEQLVTRELIRLEVDRFAVAAPLEAAVEARLRSLADGQAVESWLAAVAALGVPPDGLRRLVADDLRIDAYLDQRFAAAAQPTEAEVVERARADGAGVPVPAPALEDARAVLVTERRQRLIDDWVAGLRRRSAVRVVAPPR